jgi:hypothetical protein
VELRKSRRPAPFLDESQARLASLLGEYNAIRAELVAAVATRQTVMTYGLAAIAVIYSGLLASWSNVPVRTGILSLAPVLLVFVWFVWYGEVQRLGRARWFLWELEQKVNALLRPVENLPTRPTLPASDVLRAGRAGCAAGTGGAPTCTPVRPTTSPPSCCAARASARRCCRWC